jgi:hypothetical protein
LNDKEVKKSNEQLSFKNELPPLIDGTDFGSAALRAF